MPERSTISTVFQLGVESTPGTGVAANKLIPNLQLEPAIKAEVDQIAPQGFIFDTFDALNREWTEADYSGYPTYESLSYLLCGLITNTTPVVSGTTGQKWTHAPTSTGGDTIKTYTLESGSAARAGKFTYGLINSMKLKWGRAITPELSGTILGGQYQDGITMTASPTTVALTPITPGQIDLYLDTTSGGLGTTKLLKVREAEWTVDGRWSPVWFLNSANASWAGHAEIKPTSTLKVKAVADATSMGWLTNLRAGSTLFARIQATGGVIGAGPAVNSVKADLALQVKEVGKFADEDGLYAIEWTFSVVHNATWTKAMSIEVINSLATL